MIFGAISMGEALIRIVYSAGLDSSWWPAGAFGCDVALISATALCEGSRSDAAASPAPFRNRLLESEDFAMTFSLGVLGVRVQRPRTTSQMIASEPGPVLTPPVALKLAVSKMTTSPEPTSAPLSLMKP